MIENDFIGFMTTLFKQHGMDSAMSKIFATLYIEPKELSIEELSKRTGYSLASISMKMKILDNFGVVTRIKKPGTKKVYYYAEKDIKKIWHIKIEKVIEFSVDRVKDALPKMISKYKNQKLDKDDAKRLKIINNYYRNIIYIEKLLLDLKEKIK